MPQKGFSLLELSIVLVVIGLLASGVLVGQHLVRAAEIRSILTDAQHYQTALHTFQSKYRALPGDMSNATDYWGVAAGTGNDNTCYQTDTSQTKATCNGNGDGLISLAATLKYEWFLAWKHLSNADLLPGTYSGMTASGAGGGADPSTDGGVRPGINAPLSKMSTAGFTLTFLPEALVTAWGDWFPGTYGHVLLFGTADGIWETKKPAITGSEALSVDLKADDGKPGTGFVRTQNSLTLPDCVTSTSVTGATYKTANDTIACTLIFANLF